MLTEVKVFSLYREAPTLLLNENGRAETDFIQIRNIDGLDPVKASVNTSPFGSVDGSSHIGSSVMGRNIVLTLHPNPDWATWTFEKIRRLLYSYFMSKSRVKLVFYSDDMDPVYIMGIVEDIMVNPYTKDQEFIVSIICPDPYFTGITPIVVYGSTDRIRDQVVHIDYKGTVETGFKVRVDALSGYEDVELEVLLEDPVIKNFKVTNLNLSPQVSFEMSSVPMKKYVRELELDEEDAITNILHKVEDNAIWPFLQPGRNDFYILTDEGEQEWRLTYSERFGGL